VSIVGASMSIVGASMSIVGASVSVVGASVSIVGASVSVVGASVSVVGASVSVVGASYENKPIPQAGVESSKNVMVAGTTVWVCENARAAGGATARRDNEYTESVCVTESVGAGGQGIKYPPRESSGVF